MKWEVLLVLPVDGYRYGLSSKGASRNPLPEDTKMLNDFGAEICATKPYKNLKFPIIM